MSTDASNQPVPVHIGLNALKASEKIIWGLDATDKGDRRRPGLGRVPPDAYR